MDYVDAQSLAAAARRALRHGRFVAAGRDGETPAMALLDDLTERRSDWHPAIAEALALLLCDPDPEVGAAALDALDAGGATAALLPLLEPLLAGPAADARSLAPLQLRPDAAPLTLAAVLERARPLRTRAEAEPALIVLRTPRVEVVRLHGVDDALALARRCAAAGHSLTGGGVGGNHPLDWLRALALLAPRWRPAVPTVLAALLAGADAERHAALTYAVLCGDKHEVVGTIASAAADPALGARSLQGGPLRLDQAPAPTVAALGRWLQAAAEAERATAPRASAHEA